MGFIKDFFADTSGITAIQEKLEEAEKKLEAIGHVQAVIEFDPRGIILDANDIFLSVMEYNYGEIVGKHHSIFVDSNTRESREYKDFWSKLRRGVRADQEFLRITKSGKKVWIKASYNPLKDKDGKVFKIIKYASDITKQKKDAADNAAKLTAIDSSQATIEFNMDGTIITANSNFLAAVGYTLEEIVGHHHSMFVGREDASSESYRQFWEKLRSGNFDAGEYKRHTKTGADLWIQASYNPVFGPDGKPFKVIKYAADITAEKTRTADLSGQLDAINSSQAVIEFTLDGTIVSANKNFLTTLGYSVDEIKNRHHSMFVSSNESKSKSYKTFWKKLSQGEFASGEFKRITKSGEEIWIQATYTPILDASGRPYKVVKFASDITEQKRQAQENKRVANISNALKLCQAGVMLTDESLRVVYANNKIEKLLKVYHSQIAQRIPGFSVNSLIGMQVENFYPDARRQRDVFSKLNDSERTKLEISELVLELIASPWLDVEGRKIGYVIEWVDRTEEATAEKEINEIITAVSNGNLSLQVGTEDKNGFYLSLAEGLNSLTSTVEVAINDIVRVLGAMARGDLSERITRDYAGSFGQLRSDTNETAEKLTEITSNIRISANTIATFATEISDGNADLRRRTDQQATALQQTASSMEQMTSAVRQSAENAQSANEKAVAAQSVAQKGGDVVKKAVISMGEINEASKKISDIISVIDEIAFQTNLLALNAAVEAARAGEQGRGFAVVAGEVRNLAQRSAGAAKEIKDLIRDTVQKVEDGTELVNASGETLSQIVVSVEEVAMMMEEIANAAREQTAGIEQVNSAISQMDETTQKNAALVEESTAAGESMSDQSRQMTQVVSFFSTTGEGGLSTEIVNTGHLSQKLPEDVSESASEQVSKETNTDHSETRTPVNEGVSELRPQVSVQLDTSSDDEWEDF